MVPAATITLKGLDDAQQLIVTATLQNGTLFDQFVGTVLAGNFRGKTGSLDGVSGLTGVLDLGRRIRFAFLDNGAFTETQGGVIRYSSFEHPEIY